DRDQRLAGQVPSHHEDVRGVMSGGVDELLPAEPRAVDVACVEEGGDSVPVPLSEHLFAQVIRPPPDRRARHRAWNWSWCLTLAARAAATGAIASRARNRARP